MNRSIAFKTFVPSGYGSFTEQVDELQAYLLAWLSAEKLTPAALLHTRVYLTDAANQWNVLKASDLYVSVLEKGAVGYVEQPLLCGAKVALLVTASTCGEWVKSGSADCLFCEHDGLTCLFHTVRLAADEAKGLDSEAQMRLAFEKHGALLARKGWNLADNCLRTWIYVRDVDRNYAGVVTGRNKTFAEAGLTRETHYIASTGIEGNADNAEALVSVDFLTVSGLEPGKISYLQAPEYLNPTYEYGVAFERATAVDFPTGRYIFISGTASIDKHGECVHRGDVLTQAGRAFLNIERLLEAGGAGLQDLQYILVYLRDISDRERVASYLSLRFPNLPFLLLQARVCRPEWLIEVEGVAVANH